MPYTDTPQDLALTEALETDPETMRHLGGPAPLEQILKAHRRRSQADDDWWLKIVPERRAQAAGVIGIWSATFEGKRIDEAGWMVLPEYRGQGIATRALGLLLRMARAEKRIEAVHAFPNVANEASNSLCRRAGFELLGEHDLEFRGRPVRCNHWAIEVSE